MGGPGKSILEKSLITTKIVYWARRYVTVLQEINEHLQLAGAEDLLDINI